MGTRYQGAGALALAGALWLAAADARPAQAEEAAWLPSSRADQRLAGSPLSVTEETAPGPFDGMAALGVVADVLAVEVPVQPPPGMAGAEAAETGYRFRPCVEARFFDALGACVGYAFGGGDARWVVDLTFMSLSVHGVNLSAAASLADGSENVLSLRLALPLYAPWMPFKLPRTRLRGVWTPERIGLGVEWGWM